jgi:gliding motility-associated-like protein
MLQARQIGNSALWSPGTNLDNRNSYTPVFRGLVSQQYNIQMKTSTGCVTVDTQFVKTFKKIEIYVPSVFTPGIDGKNDFLRPLLFGFSKVNYFRVYNRWGQLVYEMQSDRPGWDGNVKGNPEVMQAVVWMIEAVDVDGKLHKQQGTSLLMR